MQRVCVCVWGGGGLLGKIFGGVCLEKYMVVGVCMEDFWE